MQDMYITPCVGICVIDPKERVCDGCKRTIQEISNWSKYTYEQRMIVMKRLGYGRRRERYKDPRVLPFE